MTVTSVEKDPTALTMTITAEYDASVAQVWSLWSNPRKLERWWGPPTYPATFVDHELVPGGRVTYYMTSPEGDRYHGWWTIRAVEPPHRLEFEDGFADESGNPNLDMPVTNARVTIDAQGGGPTRMVIHSTFPSTEAMEQLIAMGMEEGIVAAVGQIDAILAEGDG